MNYNNNKNNLSYTARYVDIVYTTATGIEDNKLAVLSFDLLQNYPNPFNPETKIEYWLPSAGKITLKIYDVLGREIESLVDKMQDAGKYEINWNAARYSSGVYFYNIVAGSNHSVKKMLLIK